MKQIDNLKIYDVRVQPGDSAFLLDDGKTSILYDTGFGFTGFDVAKKIKNILGDRNLDFIFLTHSHYDHALGSAYILRYYPEAKVVAGKYAAEIFKRPGAKAVMKDLDSKFAAQCGVFDYEFLGDELRVDIATDDGDVIHAGDMTFRVINLPGHTKCSVGYYSEDLKLLLATESLGVFDGDRIIAPSYLVSFKAALESIEKIKVLEIKNILAPHLGILDDKQTQFFLENAKDYAIEAADFIKTRIINGIEKDDIIKDFKNKYRRGYIVTIYPEDAVNLNTSIMIDMLKREFEL